MVSGGVSNILWGVGMNIIGLYKFRDNAQLETIVFLPSNCLGVPVIFSLTDLNDSIVFKKMKT